MTVDVKLLRLVLVEMQKDAKKRLGKAGTRDTGEVLAYWCFQIAECLKREKAKR